MIANRYLLFLLLFLAEQGCVAQARGQGVAKVFKDMPDTRLADSLCHLLGDSNNVYTDSLLISCSFVTSKTMIIGAMEKHKYIFLLSIPCQQLIICKNSSKERVLQIHMKEQGVKALLSIFNDRSPN